MLHVNRSYLQQLPCTVSRRAGRIGEASHALASAASAGPADAPRRILARQDQRGESWMFEMNAMHLDAVHEAHRDRLVESVFAGRLAQQAAALQTALGV
jgi:hypothetical protein